MNNAELITELIYCANIEKRKLLSDAADALEAAERLLDQNTERCEALRKQLREAHESYEKHIAELEAQIPKRGELIEDDATYCGADRANYKCSRCGKICGTWKRGLTQNELPNYCPSCGARMRTVTDCHTLEEGER
jgi:DNA-directed RNA polymerase subunit RPC12/RpoP